MPLSVEEGYLSRKDASVRVSQEVMVHYMHNKRADLLMQPLSVPAFDYEVPYVVSPKVVVVAVVAFLFVAAIGLAVGYRGNYSWDIHQTVSFLHSLIK